MPLIDPGLEPRLHGFLEMAVKRMGCSVLAINGMPDHVHLLVALHPDVAASKLSNQLKGGSSFWVNKEFGLSGGFAWSKGYGAFSVSPRDKEKVRRYIMHQKEHHKERSFENEWTWMSAMDSHR